VPVTILREKLAPPDLPPRVLRRPRLERRWRRWSGRRLVLVTAGAGWGKTTLLAAGARRADRPVAWYALDEADADPLTFLHHLLAAVTGRAVDRRTREHWRDAREEGLDALRHQGVADIVSRLRRRPRLLITLDDAQALIGSPVIPLLARLVRYLPAGVTLLVAGREPPGLPVARLRAAGALDELSGDDLRFTPAETTAFLARRLGQPVDPALAERAARVTEGWVAGLEVLIQAAAGGDLAAALARFRRGGGDWTAYFAEEVMASLAPDLRRFLVESAVLPVQRPALCDRVLRRRDSGRLLSDLAERHLFTYRLPGDPPAYRYHALFHDFLRRRLETIPSRRRLVLLRRAAAVLEEAGEHGAALAALAAAGDHAALLRLAGRHGEAVLAGGGADRLRRSLEAVPEALLSRSAPALRLLGRVAELAGDWEEAVHRYQQALDTARGRGRRAELMSLIARIAVRRGELAAAEEMAAAALPLAAARDRATRLRLLTVLGVAACEQGRLDEAERRLAAARRLLGRDAAAEGHPDLYLLPGNIHYRRGDLAAADAAVRRALLVFRRRDDRRRICHGLGVLAFLAAEACRVEEARDLARECLRLADRLGYVLMAGYAELALGRSDLLEGETETAAVHAGRAAAAGRETGESGLATLSLLLQGEIALAAGDRAAADARAGEMLTLARRLGVPYPEAQALLLRGRAAHRRGDTAQRDADWAAAEAIARRVGMALERHRLLLLRLAFGDMSAGDGEAPLRELVAGTEALAHDFLFTALEREAACRVLPRALAAGIAPERCARLLEAIGPEAAPALAPLLQTPARRIVIPLLARMGGEEAHRLLAGMRDGDGAAPAPARRAVAELRRRPAVPLRLRALGPLEVGIGDRVVSRGDWRSRRALRLLQLLLVHQFRWVPVDQVLEALWPDGDPRRGRNNLRQTLLLLRRVLEPGRPGAAAVYVRHHGEACRLDPGEGHTYDVTAFTQAADRAAAARRNGDDAAALELLAEACRLYRDDFLSASPYEEFTVPERERLRERFRRVLQHRLELLAARERWSELVPVARRGLERDPFAEECHYHLVHGLYRLGSRREALDAYHRYAAVMDRELGLLPARRMRDLAERIASAAG